MFALIFENKVVDISINKFPVSTQMKWIEFDEKSITIKIGYFYINNQFKLTDKLDSDYLSEMKDLKLKFLNQYHFNSKEIRQLSINDYFKISLSSEGRNLIAEQINQLQQQIDLGLIQPNTAFFVYHYNDKSIDVSLLKLKQLYVSMLSITNLNFAVYKNHQLAINKLNTIEEIENYDITNNYIKNKNIEI